MISKRSHKHTKKYYDCKHGSCSNFHLWYINELQTPTYQRHHHLEKINTNKVGMLWERQQVSQKRIILQIHRHGTWEDMRNWYAIKLQVWHIWGWWIINMILYTLQNMHHLNLTHHSNKDVLSKKSATNSRFANKEIHAKS